jgi:hypothetical protein
MGYRAAPRNKDRWSIPLPASRSGSAALFVTIVQTVLLAATVSSFATGGGLYGCTSACGTAGQPVTPPLAILLGVVMLVLPLIIGMLSEVWQLAVALAVIPVIPALLISSNTMLVPTNTIVPPSPAQGNQPAVPFPTSHFGPPFWLDPTHLPTLVFAFAFFALLGWLGWVMGSVFHR